MTGIQPSFPELPSGQWSWAGHVRMSPGFTGAEDDDPFLEPWGPDREPGTVRRIERGRRGNVDPDPALARAHLPSLRQLERGERERRVHGRDVRKLRRDG